MTGDDFRRLALDLNDAIEGAHMGHPDFRAGNGRIFASLTAAEDWAVVMITPDEQKALITSDPDVFVPAAGAWGRQGCTKIWLQSAVKSDVRGALTLAWERIGTMPASRTKKRRPSGKAR